MGLPYSYTDSNGKKVTEEEMQKRVLERFEQNEQDELIVKYIAPVNYNGKSKTDHIKELTKKQDGLCAICGANFSYKRKRVLDHCHTTGAIRGLLCYSCNIGLGNFRDDARLLLCAMEYLNQSKEQHWWSNLPEVWTPFEAANQIN